MKYVAMKSGTRYIDIRPDGSFHLVKSVKQAMLWPIDMESHVEEGLDKIKESGLNVRLVYINGTGE